MRLINDAKYKVSSISLPCSTNDFTSSKTVGSSIQSLLSCQCLEAKSALVRIQGSLVIFCHS